MSEVSQLVKRTDQEIADKVMQIHAEYQNSGSALDHDNWPDRIKVVTDKATLLGQIDLINWLMGK